MRELLTGLRESGYSVTKNSWLKGRHGRSPETYYKDTVLKLVCPTMEPAKATMYVRRGGMDALFIDDTSRRLLIRLCRGFSRRSK